MCKSLPPHSQDTFVTVQSPSTALSYSEIKYREGHYLSENYGLSLPVDSFTIDFAKAGDQPHCCCSGQKKQCTIFAGVWFLVEFMRSGQIMNIM